MARWNKVDDLLNNLSKYRNNSNWNDFFNKIEEIRTLDNDINIEMHNDPSDTTELDKQVKSKIKWLENNKENMARKTQSQDEYDSVYNIIDEISDEFAHLA